MANDPLSRLASAIGLITQSDENLRAAAVLGATKLLARHGLDWRDVGQIVATRLAGGPGATPRAEPSEAPKSEPGPAPQRPQDPEDDSAEERAWTDWRRKRGGGVAPRPRRATRTREATEAQRRTGINVPGEIFGRIVLRTSGKGAVLSLDVDDENVIYGPLHAYHSLVQVISRSEGRRVYAKVVAPRDRNSMPRIYSIEIM